MLCRSTLLLCALLAAPLCPRAQTVPAVPSACDADPAFTMPNAPLEHLAAALAAGDLIHILAIGSGTTVGLTNGPPGASFPYRMVDALRATLPKIGFDLTVRGGRNMTAEAMLPLLTEALHARRYPLVLWQTGTVEAVRGVRPEAMQAALEEGIDAVHDAGGDVVLIDPQFSRFLRANADLDPYESVLDQVADLPGVALFHRFDLMHDWAMSGRIDLERVREQDRPAAIALLNTCLGDTLAQFVLNSAATQPR